MTGTLTQQQQTYALDPPTLSADLEERQAEPILATCEIEAEERAKARFSIATPRECACSYRGMGLAALARLHMIEPRLATRAALLSQSIVTRADAIAAVDLAAALEGDGQLTDHLLVLLRQFLTVD